MLFTIILAVACLLAMVSADLMSVTHNECDYSGVIGSPWAQGTCNLGGPHGAGLCAIGGFQPAECDFSYHNDAGNSPCGNAQNSQYACKSNGQPCWAFHWAEDQSKTILHCGVA